MIPENRVENGSFPIETVDQQEDIALLWRSSRISRPVCRLFFREEPRKTFISTWRAR